MIFILTTAIELIVSLIKPLKKYSPVIAFFFNLSVMIFRAKIVLENNL